MAERTVLRFEVPGEHEVPAGAKVVGFGYQPEREAWSVWLLCGFVIWSFEHRQWWAPNQQGYTPDLEKAGRYSKREAGDIVTTSVLCDEVAILESVARSHGAPTVEHLWR